ncbi:hypothetical protein PL9214291096 [Planktothrix tepida PCC 9214]|uniref:Uncharacterized protein n=1 Tax=Planktothrix tepida PCC 9214 TaxID=671072 RepID=A0A1J1LIV9_9CYAN|nr:hypothetical protein PL9214291096 [Planktothrix tepida PCC 9214]
MNKNLSTEDSRHHLCISLWDAVDVRLCTGGVRVPLQVTGDGGLTTDKQNNLWTISDNYC